MRGNPARRDARGRLMLVNDLRGRPLPFGPWTLPETGHLLVGTSLSVVATSNLGVLGACVGGAATVGGIVVSRAMSSRRQLRAESQSPGNDAETVFFGDERELASAPVVDGARRAALERRAAAVRAAVEQLDAEWLSYELDLEAYFLTKPILRDGTVEQTAAYNAALFELRELAGGLAADSSEQQVCAAEDAAETALVAWGLASDHAAQVGISDRSPVERAALRRVHGLVGQLTDPGTPREMWSNLSRQIERELGKLTTVRVPWRDLQMHPAIASRAAAALGTGI